MDGASRTYRKAHATLYAAPGIDFSLFALFAPEAYRPLGANIDAGATAIAPLCIYTKHIATTSVPSGAVCPHL